MKAKVLIVGVVLLAIAGIFVTFIHAKSEKLDLDKTGTNGRSQVAPIIINPLEVNKPTSEIPPPEERIYGQSGIIPPKINIGSIVDIAGAKVDNRYYPGKEVKFDLTIWNGHLETKQYRLSFGRPNPESCYPGWTAAPEYVYKWVSFSDNEPIVEPRSEKKIEVTLHMPRSAEVFASRWEFLVHVLELNPNASILWDIAARVFVNMRD